jgi:hypothetical protein
MTTKDEEQKKTRIERLILLVFFFGSLSLLFLSGNLLLKGGSSKSWPKTTGRILQSELGKEGKVTVARIRYRYRVNDQPHESDRVLFGPSGGTQYETVSASWFTRRFPKNSRQWVFYNPSRPWESVLLPGVTRGAKSMAGAGLLFLLAGLFLYFRRQSPSRTSSRREAFRSRLHLQKILGLMLFITFIGMFGYIFLWPSISDWLAEKGVISKAHFETALAGRKIPPPKAAGAGLLSEKKRQRDRAAAPRKPDRREKARITDHRPEGCVAKGGAVELYGKGFGSDDNRRVVLAGNGISVPLRVVSWADQRITAEVPEDPQIQDAEGYYFGLQKRKSEDRHYVWASQFYGVTTCVPPVANAVAPEDRPFRGTLFVSDRRGVFRVDAEGKRRQLSPPVQAIEACWGSLFALKSGTIQMLDAENGDPQLIASIPEEVAYHHDFVVLPDLSFALLDNQNDAVYFIDGEGGFQRKVTLTAENRHWQNLSGVVVKDDLVLSEDGNKRLLKVDLQTDDVSVLKDFSDLHNWLGAIDHDQGWYYLCQARRCYIFGEEDAAQPFCVLDQGVISGMAVEAGVCFLADRKSGTIYRVNRKERRPELFCSGFYKPNDIAIMPSDG